MSGEPRSVSVDDAFRIIRSCRLSTIRGTWQYSWSLSRFFDQLLVYAKADRLHVFHPTPIHRGACPLSSQMTVESSYRTNIDSLIRHMALRPGTTTLATFEFSSYRACREAAR